VASVGAAEPASAPGDLFYRGLVEGYTGSRDWVSRAWLEQQILDRLGDPDCRYVVLVGEPGAGKTGLTAALADAHPRWPRYFIRSDSTTPLSGGDAASMLLRVGHQLAQVHPELFESEQLEIAIEQRVQRAEPGSEVVGARIEDLSVSPFQRTAIRVTQEAGHLGTRMTGVDIANATVEPRVLDPSVLQYLALLDPAAVLAARDPGARIVILVDALDELSRFRGGMSILDWLERVPELPANVRFVVTSRPMGQLNRLCDGRAHSVRSIRIVGSSEEVAADSRYFAARLFRDPALEATSAVADPEAAADELVGIAAGNFAYLNAYARALRGAVADGRTSTVDALLGFDALPKDLHSLYAYFMRLVRKEVEEVGSLEIKPGDASGGGFTPAWEGVGQRFLGTLAVARAPLSLEQLIAFGSVRVWPRDARNVLERFAPFLNRSDGGWRLFHASLVDFLTAGAESGYEDVAVDAPEWHQRVVGHYRATADSWGEVDWHGVDDYGILHLPEHLLELDEGGGEQLRELVNPGLRAASRDRFLTDLPFRRVVDAALAEPDGSTDLGAALGSTVFLTLVRSGLRAGGARLAPAVLGLMAGLGRVEEALARCDLMRPSEHRFRSLEAVVASVGPGDCQMLGAHGGIELLVAAALEIPMTEGSVIDTLGYQRHRCLAEAATKLAPLDLDRALELASIAEEEGESEKRDEVLLAAARELPPDRAAELIERVAAPRRALAAAEAAGRAEEGPEREALIDLATEHLDEASREERIEALALLARLLGDPPSGRAAHPLEALRAAMDSPGEKGPYYEERRARIEAAKRIWPVDEGLADALLQSLAGDDEDSRLDSWSQLQAARVWASAGQEQRARTVLDGVLAHLRGLGWFGPAADIARAAVIVDGFDSKWAQELADEAVALIEGELDSADRFERGRLDSTLGQIVEAFKGWDDERALQIARAMRGSWVPGAGWKIADGRLSALAVLGLSRLEENPTWAAARLEECLRHEDDGLRVGRLDGHLLRGGLFRPSGETAGTSSLRAANFFAYTQNAIGYWLDGRKWRFFASPVEVLRRMGQAPASVGAFSSWADVVAAAVPIVAREDPQQACELTRRIVDPCERLIACGGLAGELPEGDRRLGGALAALDRTAATLPEYVPELELEPFPQGPVLAYLNPANRARVEAALQLEGSAPEKAIALVKESDSWYLEITFRSESRWQMLWSLPRDLPDDFAAAVAKEVEALSEHPDQLQADLLRVAVARALAAHDPAQAQEAIDAIEQSWIVARAQLYACAAPAADGQSRAEACLDVLRSLPEEVSPLHRGVLAAIAISLVEEHDPKAASPIFEWGAETAREADALSAVHAMFLLAHGGHDIGALLRSGLSRVDEVDNPYLRSDVLADALRPALRTGDEGLILEVAQRLLESGWQIFAEGLRRGIGEFLRIAGVEGLAALDAALRQAQALLDPAGAQEHFDGVAPPGSSPAPADLFDEPRLADPARYASLYLDEDDLPASLSLEQDSRAQGPAANDFWFTLHAGVHSGFQVWVGDMADTVWRVVDIRHVFPDEEAAATYLEARRNALREDSPILEEAETVGASGTVSGGAMAYSVGEAEAELTAYYYVFRVGSVVAKFFAAQGPKAAEPLVPEAVKPLAERVAERIEAAGVG
jgi:hypothetical protein